MVNPCLAKKRNQEKNGNARRYVDEFGNQLQHICLRIAQVACALVSVVDALLRAEPVKDLAQERAAECPAVLARAACLVLLLVERRLGCKKGLGLNLNFELI